MDFSSFVILTIFLFLCYKWLKSCINERTNEPPVVVRFDLKQHAKLVDHNNRCKEFVKISKKNGVGIYTLSFLGMQKTIVMNDWNIIKEVLVGQADIISGKPVFYVFELLGQETDIASSSGPLCKEKRRFLIEYLKNLEFGTSLMEVRIQNEISRFIQHKLEKEAGKEIQINELMQIPVLNVLWGIMAGKTYYYDNELIKHLLQRIDTNFALVTKTLPIEIFPILRFVPFDTFSLTKLIAEFTVNGTFYDNEIEEHITTYQEGNINDFIDSYLEKIFEMEKKRRKGTAYEKRHLIGILENLFSIGIGTTATTIEWALLYMALWPEIQEKVQNELDVVVGRNRQPSLLDRSSLPYANATIMEVQRYASVMPISIHRALADTNVLGYNVSKTTTILSNIWAVHFDEKLWGDPQVFRPERFINSEGKVEKPEYFIPFSIGSRCCPGEQFAQIQLFLFFTCLLQRFNFKIPTGKPLPSLEPVVTLTQNPKPFSLVIESR